MSDCETWEMSISALADGELPAGELLPAIDHLAECPACQAFYRDVRALAAALPGDGLGKLPASPAEASPQEAPEEIWRRIEAEAAPALAPARRMQPWALRLAAALLLAAGLWVALAPLADRRPAGAPIEITLGEDGERMTEQRFVDLAVELLRADPRYHQEMYQVLSAVVEGGEGREASADYDLPFPEEDDESDRGPSSRRRT